MSFPNVLDWLQSLPEPGLLAGTGLLLMGEGLAGFVIPGDAALLVAAATVGSVADFLILWAVAITCSVAGNVVAFEIGRRVGPPLRDTRMIQKHGATRWDKATSLLHKHGAWAVFIGRVIPFVRNVVPAVAGAAGFSYRIFLAAAVGGAACATALPILFTVAVAQGVKSTNSVVNIAVAGALAALVVAVVVRKRRVRAKAQAALPDVSPDNHDHATSREI